MLGSSCSLVDLDAHHPVLNIELKAVKIPKPVYKGLPNFEINFKKLDIDHFTLELVKIDWDSVLSPNDPNTLCNSFYDIIYSITRICIPNSGNVTSSNRIYPVWFNSKIKSDLKLKEAHRLKYKATGSQFHYDQFSQLRASLKSQVAIARANYIKSAESKFDSQPSSFWSLMKKLKHNKNSTQSFVIKDQITTDPSIIANSFADYFGSVFLPASGAYVTSHSLMTRLGSVSPPTCDEVFTAMQKLPDKWSAGVDGIPCCLVKSYAGLLAEPLTIIFKACLKHGTYPDCWKISKIYPILKTGDPAKLENYRLISILCAFSKVFEIYLYAEIYRAFKPSLSQFQHGFVPGRSTVTNLLCFTRYVHTSFLAGHQVDTIYTDFSKAFDKVNISNLVEALSSIGLPEALITLLASYLHDRRNRVIFGSTYSKIFNSTSGVPQGSNLGPLLFIIFLNSLLDLLNRDELACAFEVFADDLKLYSAIRTVRDCFKFQRFLNLFVTLCKDLDLFLNINKCKVMSYCRKKSPILFNYEIIDILVTRVNLHSDLGITFDTKLNFQSHVGRVVTSSWKMLGFVTRSSRNLYTIKAIKAIYFSLIRSRLEYASVVWSPIHQVHSSKVDKIQNKFLKFLVWKLDGFYPEPGTDYNTLRARFKFLSLQERRLCDCAIFLSRLIQDKVDCGRLLELINFKVPVVRAGPPFHLPLASTSFATSEPIYRLMESFNFFHNLDNNLEPYLITNVNSFKRLLMQDHV